MPKKEFSPFLCLTHTRALHTSFISNMNVDELVSKSSSTPILVKIWSATRNEAYSAGTQQPGQNNTQAFWSNRREKKKHTQLCVVAHWMMTWLTYLSHDLTQGHLFEVGGLAAHVRSSDDDEVAARGDEAVVGHVLVLNHSLQNGVMTVLDGQSVCELWPH